VPLIMSHRDLAIKKFIEPDIVMNTRSLNTHLLFNRLALAALISLAGAEATAKEKTAWSSDFELQAAHGYDSAVSVDELDAYSRQGDNYWQLKLKNKSQWQINDRWTLKGGVGYSDKRYNELDIVNTRITQANISPSVKLGSYTLSTRADIADAQLNGEGFMTFKQINGALGKKVGKTMYLRGAITQSDKSFDRLSTRDADNQSIGGDIFWLKPKQGYIALNLSHEKENAKSDAFDYTGNNISLSYQGQYFDQALKVTIAGHWSNRSYETVTITEVIDPVEPNEPDSPFPFLDDEAFTEQAGDEGETQTRDFTREDTRLKISTDATYAFNKTVSLVARVSFSDIQSNEVRVDLDKYDASIGVVLNF